MNDCFSNGVLMACGVALMLHERRWADMSGVRKQKAKAVFSEAHTPVLLGMLNTGLLRDRVQRPVACIWLSALPD